MQFDGEGPNMDHVWYGYQLGWYDSTTRVYHNAFDPMCLRIIPKSSKDGRTVDIVIQHPNSTTISLREIPSGKLT